jgi:cellulose synthase/poly-beta-1,6-N-acetylglucosamine synthase-like glycosyltransferase
MAQAGRWKLFSLCTIPGTNFVIHKSILEKIGGWDTKAVTEDTEISFRIYEMGYHIRFCPYSTTWEQEPETLPVWFKQRKRWVKGNYYVMFKNFSRLLDPKMGTVRLDILYFLSVYILFFSAAVTSDIIFILGFTGFIETTIIGYSFLLWLAAYIIFIMSVQISISVERHELTLSNFFVIVFMYFSYCKLWTFVALVGLLSFIKDLLFKRENIWYKTERF